MKTYRGSTIVPIRLNDELLEILDDTIERVNKRHFEEPFNRTSFIRKAICDKLRHYERSKRKEKTNETVSPKPEEV
jgi:metal-responsive CopG/Arc/MetJ family transcriptional regulator